MSIFPTKILLATDGSREAELAARTAADLANSTNSELHIVLVGGGYSFSEPADSTAQEDAVLEMHRRKAREILDEQVRKVEESGATVKQVHLNMSERPDRAIVALGEELGAGLIVIGSRGRGGIRRALLGSVSDSVVRHAHCPVMVVRAEK
jgi:nucleotide-binding universal stress UspA family protein